MRYSRTYKTIWRRSNLRVPSAWQELRGAVEGRQSGPAKGEARGPGGDGRSTGDAKGGEDRLGPGEVIPHYPPGRGDDGGGCSGVVVVVVLVALLISDGSGVMAMVVVVLVRGEC